MRKLGVCTGNRNNPKLTHGAGRQYAVRMETNYSRGRGTSALTAEPHASESYPSHEHHLARRDAVTDTGGMSRTQEQRRQVWRKRMSQQEQSGLSVRAFCQQHRTS